MNLGSVFRVESPDLRLSLYQFLRDLLRSTQTPWSRELEDSEKEPIMRDGHRSSETPPGVTRREELIYDRNIERRISHIIPFPLPSSEDTDPIHADTEGRTVS